MGVMSQEKGQAGFQVNSGPITAGVVLAGAGALLGLAGLVIISGALAGAARRWAMEQQMPPKELAVQQWTKARAATAAGRMAWRNGMQQPAATA
jgi:hypothetical protein